MRRTMKWTAAGGLLLVVLAMGWPYASLLAPQRLRDYVYREITYARIVRHVTRGESSPDGAARRLAGFVHDAVYPYAESGTQSNFLDNLVAGIGVCYDHSGGLVTLAYHAGIDGRTRFMAGPFTHSVAELLVDGKWRYFDPYFGLLFTNRSSGEVVSIEEIRASGATSDKVVALERYDPEVLRNYFALIPKGTWGPFSTTQDAFRESVRRLAGLTVRLWGFVLPLYQDLYLARSTSLSPESIEVIGVRNVADPAFPDLYRARHRHLWQRLEAAEPSYREVIALGAATRLADDALYFLGQSYREREMLAAAAAAFERVIADHADSQWKPPATYALAAVRERLGDHEQAVKLYEGIASVSVLDGAVRLMELSDDPVQK